MPEDLYYRRDLATAHIPALLRQYGVAAQVGSSFGTETNPDGLRVITGHKLVT